MALDVPAIQRHLARLAELAPDDPRWWRAGPKWSAAKVRRFDAAHFTLPADYRTWLVEIGDGGLLLQRDDYKSFKTWGAMRPLAGRKRAELATAALPFRITRDCKAREPVAGVLYIGLYEGSNSRYLVTTGKRAGEIWERSVYTDWFYRHGTFSELVDEWVRQSTKIVEAWAAPRDPAKLAALEPSAHFGELVAGLVPWLRAGSDFFVDAFRELPRDKRHDAYFAFEGALNTYADQLAESPARAGAAAGALLGVLEERYRPHLEVEHALVSILDAEVPDLSPANVARLIAGLPTGRGRTLEHEIANWPAKWVQMTLRNAGRLDEALALFRVQPFLLAGDWLALGRALAAKGRAAEAFAAIEELITNPGRPGGERRGAYETARATLHLELGDRDAAIAALERARTDYGDYGDQLLAAVRAKRDDTLPKFHTSHSDAAVALSFGRPQDYGLVALLYGIAGDGAHMIDAAVRALSVEAVRRDRQDHTNHTAHLRIGQAMLGKIERTPRLVVDYGASTGRATLAKALLARVGKLGIQVREKS